MTNQTSAGVGPQANGAPSMSPAQMWFSSMGDKEVTVQTTDGGTHRGRFRGLDGPFLCLSKNNGTLIILQTVFIVSIEASSITTDIGGMN